jgi:hypothetical protein
MKPIIIRKPKFMRNDGLMLGWMKCAQACTNTMSKTKNLDEQVKMLKQAGECINNAAKAGGFFSTKDYIKWLKLHDTKKD